MNTTIENAEYFLHIKGARDFSISNLGTIIDNRNGRVKKQKTNSQGFRQATIYYEEKGSKTRGVHTLVAETFIPNPEKKPEVKFKDKNKHNCHVNNLEWIYYKDSVRKGQPIKDLSGKKFGRLTACSYFRRNGQTFWVCACECGKKKTISSSNLSDTKRGTKSCGCLRGNSPRLYKAIGNKSSCWSGYEGISGTFWKTIAQNCKHSKNPLRKLEITIQDAWALFLKQNKKCALSGVELSFNSSSRCKDGNASIDRIDSNKCYSIDNVQWVHKKVNKMKMELPQAEFIDFCTKIAENFKNK